MLSTSLGKLKLKNPLILASGILGTDETILKRVSRQSVGAVTTKSIGLKEKLGNKNPAVVEWQHGFLNAVGLPSPGIKNAEKELRLLKEIKIPVIVSIYGSTEKEFADVAKKVAKFKPDMIEMDISCPHVKKIASFSGDKESAFRVVKKVRSKTAGIPLSVKLSPNVTDIAEIAKACEKAGADCITAINTLKGMLIDAGARKPVLANKIGGISGPALKPVALRCVYEIYENVKIPIIGTGGISNGKDAIEMMMAGASAVGIGTAAYYRGIDVFNKITNEIKVWMKKENVKRIRDVIGAAH